MDTVTGSRMALHMLVNGGQACLHRFASINDTLDMFAFACHQGRKPMVSIGLGNEELERAVALRSAGATHFVIDVAHGAQQAVVDQVRAMRIALGNEIYIMVGNFASADSVKEFLERSYEVDGIKVGVGPGSACTTRIKTGVGYPQLSAIKEIATLLKNTDIHVIADGGMKTPGDIAKALGAGAHMVMLGGMLSGTEETPGNIVNENGFEPSYSYDPALPEKKYYALAPGEKLFKKYRGSASQESYEAQGKTGTHRTSEGESFLVPYKGSVSAVLADIEGGIRSAMTYVGARNLDEFRGRCEFVQISPATAKENGAHGKS